MHDNFVLRLENGDKMLEIKVLSFYLDECAGQKKTVKSRIIKNASLEKRIYRRFMPLTATYFPKAYPLCPASKRCVPFSCRAQLLQKKHCCLW